MLLLAGGASVSLVAGPAARGPAPHDQLQAEPEHDHDLQLVEELPRLRLVLRDRREDGEAQAEADQAEHQDVVGQRPAARGSLQEVVDLGLPLAQRGAAAAGAEAVVVVMVPHQTRCFSHMARARFVESEEATQPRTYHHQNSCH